jgi:hypothetical protein
MKAEKRDEEGKRGRGRLARSVVGEITKPSEGADGIGQGSLRLDDDLR